MNMLRHKHKRMQFIAAFSTISIKSFQEQADLGFDDKQSPALPGRERHKVSSRRRDESPRLQSKTSSDWKPRALLRLNRHKWNSRLFFLQRVSFWEQGFAFIYNFINYLICLYFQPKASSTRSESIGPSLRS
jgi:ribosomal protein S30